jgi:lipid II:glycine glycyltransferase (peptidoglycan interpeptide bridge formation enzyme)
MKLRWLRRVDAATWDDLLARSPGGGHFLQSYAWGTLKRRFGWRPFHFVLTDDGSVPRGVALALAYRTPLGRDLLYCPKGPWVDWHDPRAVAALLDGLRAWGWRHGAFALRLEPPVAEGDDAARHLLRARGVERARWEMQYRTGWVVDLRGSEADLLAAMKPKTRYNIRLAERKGVAIVHDTSDESLRQFHELYLLTGRRDGFATRSAGYIIASCRAMVDAGRATVIWAEHDGRRLAAIVAYRFGEKAWYWLGASASEGRQLMPTYLAQWAGMRWARAHGCVRYDMTSVPASEHLREDDPFWGLYRFKSGFGGAAEELIGTCELPIDPLPRRAWTRIEPIYYRVYQKLRGDVYY